MKGGLWGSLPVAATEVAVQWDELYYFLFAICVIFFVIVIVPMVYFAVKYRKKPGMKPDAVTHNLPLEVIWTALPTVLVMIIFAWGWIVYSNMELKIPADAMEIHVVAQSWSWNFQYDDGRVTTNQLYVPVDKPIKLILTSKKTDVMHSFFVPNFRIKKDAVPGMYTSTWFKATQIGQHQVFCTEYCGVGHSAMLAKIIVLSAEQYQLWKWGKKVDLPPAVGLGSLETAVASADASAGNPAVNTAGTPVINDPVALGKTLATAKACATCHNVDGAAGGVGPTWKGVFGHEVEISDGSKVMADENYIRESILEPQKKLVKGFGPLMPSYQGQLKDEEIDALIAYIKSLK